MIIKNGRLTTMNIAVLIKKKQNQIYKTIITSPIKNKKKKQIQIDVDTAISMFKNSIQNEIK